MPDDAQLLRAYFQDGDQIAFAELVRRHLTLAYSVAFRRTGGNAAMAEEVTQRVFIDLARKSRSLATHPALAAWLLRAVHFAAIDLVRAESRRRAREDAAMPMLLNDPAPDWEKARPALDDALCDLSETDRAAVLLRCFEARPFRDVAATLKITEDAARMRVDRALERMRSNLARRGITSTSALLASALAGQASVVPPAALTMTIMTAAATVAVPTAGLASLLFMSTSKTIGVTTIIALLALSFAGFEHYRARNAESAMIHARQKNAEVERRAIALESKLRALTEQPSKTAVAAAPQSGVQTPPAATQSPSSAPVDLMGRVQSANPLSSVYQLAKINPDAAEAWLAAERSALDLQYGPLCDRLGLTTAQAERLKAILIGKFQATADITAAASAQGLPLTAPGIRAMFKDTTTKTETELHDLLGDTGIQELRRYGETMPIRQFVGALAGDVYATAPLTATQAEQLTSLIVANTKASSGGYTTTASDWGTILANAPNILSPAQFASLKAEHDQIVLRQKLVHLAKQPVP